MAEGVGNRSMHDDHRLHPRGSPRGDDVWTRHAPEASHGGCRGVRIGRTLDMHRRRPIPSWADDRSIGSRTRNSRVHPVEKAFLESKNWIYLGKVRGCSARVIGVGRRQGGGSSGDRRESGGGRAESIAFVSDGRLPDDGRRRSENEQRHRVRFGILLDRPFRARLQSLTDAVRLV